MTKEEKEILEAIEERLNDILNVLHIINKKL